MKNLIFFLVISFFILISHSLPAEDSKIYGEAEFTFDNLFTPFECFRRYHSLLVGGDYKKFNLSVQYNWLDEVEGAVSTHTLTPWVITVNYKFDKAKSIEFKYHYVIDVYDNAHQKEWKRIEYIHFLNKENNFYTAFKIGADDAQEVHLFETYLGLLIGYCLSKEINLELKYDWLTSVDDALTNSERSPLTLGAYYEFNSGASTFLEYNHMFGADGEEIKEWLRTGLKYKW